MPLTVQQIAGQADAGLDEKQAGLYEALRAISQQALKAGDLVVTSPLTLTKGTSGYPMTFGLSNSALAKNFVLLQATTPGTPQTGNLAITGTGLFGKIGVGTTAPDSRATIWDGSSTPPAPITDTTSHLGAADGKVARELLDSFAAATAFTGRRANTSAASPSGLLSGDVMAQVTGLGYTSAGAYSAGARADMQIVASETWSGTAQGAFWRVRTTPIGTVNIQENMRVDDQGRAWLSEGTATALVSQIGGAVFTQTADSTTTANSLTTLFGTGVGSLTLPANTLIPGRTIRLKLGGVVSVNDGGAGTKTLTLKLGGTTVATGTSGATFSAITANDGWTAEAHITCRTAGAGGTVHAGGLMTNNTGSTTDALTWAVATATTSINTTTTLAVDLLYNNGNATGSLKTTYATVEIVN